MARSIQPPAIAGVPEGSSVEELRRLASEAAAATERMQLALDAGAIIGTWVWDVPQDRFVADALFARAFGLDPQDCRRGLPLDKVKVSIHPDDIDRVNRAIAQAMESGGGYRCEYRVRRQGGEYQWVEANGRVEFGSDGRPLRFPGVLISIEERLRAQAERDRAHAMLSSFIEAVPGVVYAKDRQGRMLVANRGAAELIGKPPAEFIGRTDLEFLEDKQQAAALMARDRRIMDSGVAELLEEPIRLADGSPAWWLSSKAPLRDASGAVIGLVGASIDITERIAAEQALRAREQELQEQDRRKDAFLATLAHELRNPLAALSNGLAVLSRGPALPAEGPARRTLDIMDRQLRHLVHLVDDLLDVSRINSDKITLRLRCVTVQELVAAVIEACRPALQSGRHPLQVDLPAEPLAVQADLTRLVQVLTNLVVNATKYSDPGGGVWLRATREGDQVAISVVDRGIGIPADVLPHLGEMFVQARDALERAQGGLGIGLALVRKLVQMHGGSFSAESAGPGQGSTFTVRLPLLPQEAATAAG
ncbi:PAS domain-containing protein [Ramlibacter tataouinensis]|uniref:sensor histidine kinase n=1 Tax=Ramlibacter tataouinensis TaxID=94132 RepID=UPI0022F3951B|nr:ATP-binding protein [Ramlibacter tataouinensis]WBY02325.1 PAS domain-containing protein [Ramlibacter tataouinensis]